MNTISLALRPLIHRDLEQVALIAQERHPLPWTEHDSQLVLDPETTLAWVAATGRRVVGFVFGTVAWSHEAADSRVLPALKRFFRGVLGQRGFGKLHIKLIDLCVAEGWPQAMVERALLEQLDKEIRLMGDYIEIVVPESNLPTQLFLRQVGYRATQVLRGQYESEDGYELVWLRTHPSTQSDQRSSHAVEGRVTGEAESVSS
jgi:ribosomal protein S18 acetylase RimI-like enzyme